MVETLADDGLVDLADCHSYLFHERGPVAAEYIKVINLHRLCTSVQGIDVPAFDV